MGTYAMVRIQGGKPPAGLFTDTLSRKLFLVIEDVPSIQIFFWRLRDIAESVQLLYPSELAGKGFNAAIHCAGLFLGQEIQGYEDEVATP